MKPLKRTIFDHAAAAVASMNRIAVKQSKAPVLCRETARVRVLEALTTGLSVTGALKLAGVSRSQHEKWKREDDHYAQLCIEATDAGTDQLEDIALHRARKSSDVLAIFLLKARRPEKYRERDASLLGGNGPVSVTIMQFNGTGQPARPVQTIDATPLTPAQIDHRGGKKRPGA